MANHEKQTQRKSKSSFACSCKRISVGISHIPNKLVHFIDNKLDFCFAVCVKTTKQYASPQNSLYVYNIVYSMNFSVVLQTPIVAPQFNYIFASRYSALCKNLSTVYANHVSIRRNLKAFSLCMFYTVRDCE